MEQYVYAVRSYLPVEFVETETNDFLDYLVEAFLENLPNSKLQFSFTAFHMLYMSYVYKVKWFLKERGDTSIQDGLQEYIRQNRGALFNTLFDLSQLSEKTSIEKLLKALSFHANDVDTCKNLVEVRNKCSHASGKIYFKRPQQIENYILEELDNVEAIQKKITPYFPHLFEDFINKTWDQNVLSSDIQDWIKSNYLSQRDIIYILQIKIPFQKLNSDSREVLYKKIFYSLIVSELTKHLPERGEYFLNSLRSLMKGMIDYIDIRKDVNDSEKLKSTQELIEERIVPILITLSDSDAVKAQEILKLNNIE